MRRAVSSARPIVSAAIRFRFAVQTANAAAATTAVTTAGMITFATIGNTRDVLSRVGSGPGKPRDANKKRVVPLFRYGALEKGERPLLGTWNSERTAPLCRVGRSMNLRKQVEPLKKAALQASSLQRHAHHAASRLTWVKRWLKRAYRHHAQSRDSNPDRHPNGSALAVQGSTGRPGPGDRLPCGPRYAISTRSSRRSSSPARSASSPDRARVAS